MQSATTPSTIFDLIFLIQAGNPKVSLGKIRYEDPSPDEIARETMIKLTTHHSRDVSFTNQYLNITPFPEATPISLRICRFNDGTPAKFICLHGYSPIAIRGCKHDEMPRWIFVCDDISAMAILGCSEFFSFDENTHKIESLTAIEAINSLHLSTITKSMRQIVLKWDCSSKVALHGDVTFYSTDFPRDSPIIIQEEILSHHRLAWHCNQGVVVIETRGITAEIARLVELTFGEMKRIVVDGIPRGPYFHIYSQDAFVALRDSLSLDELVIYQRAINEIRRAPSALRRQ